ncbi:hypothetical protein HMPREF0299_5759 [Corynebacterium matruchotii ATCC 14266]|uniref:Uncharacterized protein n=1 Tax=Corynebacterium matruchotii ATCC 14266 TaxID=553207 RepID=E0DBS2_9CORY|nr:hypothetical protein HMPREF0299_5759 [Corynebacterium matruchotii ATCC 14266]
MVIFENHAYLICYPQDAVCSTPDKHGFCSDGVSAEALSVGNHA